MQIALTPTNQTIHLSSAGRSGVLAECLSTEQARAAAIGAWVNRLVASAPLLDITLNTYDVRILLSPPKDAYDLTFSRDGMQMAFLRWHANLAAFTLNVAAANGKNEREVIPSGAGFSDYYAPRFSPDGRQIIFASVTGPVTDPAGYPLKARESSPIDRLLGLLAPSAAEAHGSISYIWIINTDGTGLRRLPNVGEDTPMAVFSPDGKQTVMMGNGGMYLMNGDGGNVRKIDPVGNHGGLEWAQP